VSSKDNTNRLVHLKGETGAGSASALVAGVASLGGSSIVVMVQRAPILVIALPPHSIYPLTHAPLGPLQPSSDCVEQLWYARRC